MPIRVLAHGNAATMDSVGLLPGTWDDIPSQGQFLIDVEFLTRYTQSSGGMCVYCKYPSYLPEIAALFPWLHFYVYGHTTDPEVYDPSQPDMSSPVTVQVRYSNTQKQKSVTGTNLIRIITHRYNMTISQHEYTKEMARVMGENRHSTRTLICHGVDPLRQLALHALLKPNFSLMDIAGVIPADYLEGEIILPVFIPINRIFASLVVFHSAKWASYDPEVFKAEMGKCCLKQIEGVCTLACLDDPSVLWWIHVGLVYQFT